MEPSDVEIAFVIPTRPDAETAPRGRRFLTQ